MSRQQYLLLLVAVLLLLQIVVVPAFNWLDSARESVLAEYKKSQKQRQLVESKKQLEAQMSEIDAFMEQASLYAFKADSAEGATLAIQGTVEKIAQKHDVKINRIGWGGPDTGEQEQNRIEVYISAHPADWVAMQSELDGFSWLVLDRMNFYYSRRSGDDSLIGTISGTLAYNVNLWIEDEQNN